jgi:hypothetical protein
MGHDYILDKSQAIVRSSKKLAVKRGLKTNFMTTEIRSDAWWKEFEAHEARVIEHGVRLEAFGSQLEAFGADLEAFRAQCEASGISLVTSHNPPTGV